MVGDGRYRPHDRGFDELKGLLGDMMDDYHTHRRHGINYMRFNDEVVDLEGHATEPEIYLSMAAALRAYTQEGGRVQWQR